MIVFRFASAWLLLLMTTIVSAQNEERYLPAWELGITAGAYTYQGDLTPYKIGSFKTVTPGIQVTAGKYITNTLLLRTGLTFARLKGNDHLYGNRQEYRYYRNYSFSTFLAEFQTMALAFVFNSKMDEQKLQPYLAAGGGIVFLNTKSSSAATDFSYFPQSDLPQRLAEDAQKNKRKLFFTTIAGAGAKYDLNAGISFTAEALYRFGFNDYIDGFSIAANSAENDQYYSISVGVLIKFPDNGLSSRMRKRLRCKL